jgi:hypothetical protein
MPGAPRLFRQIACASEINQLNDYLAEVRYALAFAALGFQIEIYPNGKKGPDLAVSRDAARVMVEVTRFREVHPGPPALGNDAISGFLAEYGNPERDIRKSFEKILAKLPQLSHDLAIVAVWNDDGDLEELEVRDAVGSLRQDASTGKFAIPAGFLLVIYASPWVRARDGKQIWCFPMTEAMPLQVHAWCQELESSRVSSLIHAAMSHVDGDSRLTR